MEVSQVAQASSQWYPVATKPRSEQLAAVHLRRQGFTVLAPTVTLRKRRRDGWQQVTEALFPGYLFVALILGSDDISPIRSTVGCRGLVRFGADHVPVPQPVMTPLLALGEQPLNAAKEFSTGDKVLIEQGPFAGVHGIFTAKKGSDRVQLLIELLGAQQSVVVDSRWVAVSGQ